jgi:ABC-type lipoprotein release transport system permease subunit
VIRYLLPVTLFGNITDLGYELPAPTYFVRLAEGVDAVSTSAALESVFLKNGLESTDPIQEMRDSMTTQFVFQQLLLGFLTVGLTTWLPAVQASQVTPAEALRYE